MTTQPTRREWERFDRFTVVCFFLFASSVVCTVNGMGDAFTGEQQLARNAFVDAVRIPAILGAVGTPIVWLGRLSYLAVRWFLA